jgi:acetaldehyde dehydrogenase/alcohol dehydrogenase
LINKKIVAKRAENMQWHKVPKSIYFRRGSLSFALEDLTGRKRCLIVTDRFLRESGCVDEITRILKKLKLEVACFADVTADPTLTVVRSALAAANAFEPDVILALGGGSPMDAAKIMWVLYEHPEVHFSDLALRFMDIRKRIYQFPRMGAKALLVAVPTTSGTGSEVTPFAVVTDDASGVKYPIADYELMPSMAIIDANLVMHLPKPLTAYGGIDAVSHAIEAYVSVMANEYTDGQALQALKLLKGNLPSAYLNGAADPVAREQVHNAATLAGIAFANAFLGICHSMAHSLGAAFHMSHGLAIGLLLTNSIRYNAADIPAKQTAYSKYDRPQGVRRYAEIARHLGLEAEHDHQCAARLVLWIEELKSTLEIPSSIAATGISEVDFIARLDGIAAGAFDDQCTAANPRSPLISEIRQLLLDSYHGRPFVEAFACQRTEENSK